MQKARDIEDLQMESLNLAEEFGANQKTPKAGPSGSQPGAANPSASAATDLKGERILNFDLPDGWRKKITRRMTGKAAERGSVDVYIYPPKGPKLRSSQDLLKWIMKNPNYKIDPSFVNFERTGERTHHPSPSTQKVIELLEMLRNGEMIDFNKFIKKQTRPIRNRLAESSVHDISAFNLQN